MSNTAIHRETEEPAADGATGVARPERERQPDTPVRNGDGAHTKTGAVTYRPPLDLYDLGDRYEILLDLPGTSTERIQITVHERVLTVEASVPGRYGPGLAALHAEYGVGDYRRRIRLGEDIDTEGLSAVYADGVLRVELPKCAKRRPRRVEVRAG